MFCNKKQFLILFVAIVFCISPFSNTYASEEPVSGTEITAADLAEMFPEVFGDDSLSAVALHIDTTDMRYYRIQNGIEYELNVYSDGSYDVWVAYPAQIISSSKGVTDYGQLFSYYYPIVDGMAQMTAYARYTYNSSTGINTITSCVGGGSEVVLYGWGVYSGIGEVWGNAVSEGYEFIGLNIDLTPKIGSKGLNKSTYTSDPY